MGGDKAPEKYLYIDGEMPAGCNAGRLRRISFTETKNIQRQIIFG